MNHAQSQNNQPAIIQGPLAEKILADVANWGDVTTIIIHLGSVFEFKGPFPKGTNGFGYYNLAGPTPGLHGHLKLEDVDHISFQEKPHRGRDSYALVFETSANEVIFKIFLGRDEQGEVFAHQKEKFNALKHTTKEI